MLDSEEILPAGMKRVKHEATLETMKGTMFKRFDKATVSEAPSTVVAIKIEMPTGPAQQIREDTVGGVPAHIDGETV
jgi:hypothetical protein